MNEGRVAILVVAWWSAGCGFSELTDLELSPRGTATVELLAGSIGGPGMLDARGGAARFAEPHGVAVTPGGITYVADTANCVIRKIDSEGEATGAARARSRRGRPRLLLILHHRIESRRHVGSSA